MKTYVVIYNGFWNATPPDAVRRLHTALVARGLSARMLPHTACTVTVAPQVSVHPFCVGDVALFWDKDTRLARALEDGGVHVYNTAASVALCDDKSETHRVLSAAGIPMPETLVAPMAYVEVSDAIEPFLSAAETRLGFPMVVKECFGSLGEQVYLADTPAALRELVYAMHHRPFLLQRFVADSAGKDRRLYVVGDRVVAAMERHNPKDFRANIAIGGTACAYTPTPQECDLACRCCRALGLQFGGVDLLGDGSVCEVNSNAQMSGIIACTGIDVAGAIVDYVLTTERDNGYGTTEGCVCR